MKVTAITDTHFGHAMLVNNGHREAGYEIKILRSIQDTKGDILIHTGDFCIDDNPW